MNYRPGRIFSTTIFAITCAIGVPCFANAEHLTVTARYTSPPPQWADGNASLPKNAKFVVPARIHVVEGSSADAAALLEFRAKGEKFSHHCLYRGSNLTLWESLLDFLRNLGLVLKGNLKFSDLFSGQGTFVFAMCTGNSPKSDSITKAQEFKLQIQPLGKKKRERIIVAKAVIELKGETSPTPTPTPTPVPTPFPTATPSPTPIPTATPTQPPVDLPPDPGELGKTTLQGIDSDNDGVRDDVQRLIWQMFPENDAPTLKVRRTMLEFSKIRQRSLFVSTKDDAYMIAKEYFVVSTCLTYALREKTGDLTEVEFEAGKRLESAFYNTWDRMEARRRAEVLSSGGMYKLPLEHECQ